MKTLNQSKKPAEIIKIVSFAVVLIVGFLFSSFSCSEDDIETEPETVTITFGVEVGEGELVVKVDDVEISSPAEVEKGKTVVFEAVHSKSWTIKYWKINGTTIRYIDPVLTLENVEKDTDVRLGLKEWVTESGKATSTGFN